MSKKNIIFLVAILVAILLAIGFYLYKEKNKTSSTKEEVKNLETNIIPKKDVDVEMELKEAVKVKPKTDLEVQKTLLSSPNKNIKTKTDEEIAKELKQFQ